MTSIGGHTFRYAFHGLRIASDIQLAELVELPDDDIREGEPDVIVRLGKVAPMLEGITRIAEDYLVSDGEILLQVAMAGRYHARDGKLLTVEPHAGADPGAVQLFLIGSGLAAILHQRELLPLHACAVAHRGECIAFLGNSGAGKSTLAAMLSQRGFRLLTDDVLVTRPDSEGGLLAEPSLPILKLWPQALDAAGLQDTQSPFEARNFNKHRIATPERFASETLPLTRLYFLRWLLPATAAPEIVPLDGFSALRAIRSNVYRPGLIEALGREHPFMIQCSRLLSRARTFEFRRPMDLAQADAQIDALLEHIDPGS